VRLSLKFATLIGIGATLIVLIMSILSTRHDLDRVEQDMLRDASLIAMTIASVIEHAEGKEDWGEVLGALGLDHTGVHVGWHAAQPAHPITTLTTQITDREVSATMPVADGTGYITVREDRTTHDQVLRRSIYTALLTMLAVMVLAIGAGLYVGQIMVGRPVSALVAMARRVAREDYSQQIERLSEDEFGTLGSELNQMADQLKWARDQSRADAEARHQAQLQLLHADRLRTVGQLAAGVAHELGTPLNVISGRAALLSRTLHRLDVDDGDAVIIRSQADQITHIVRRLMNYAHPAAHQPEIVSLNEICEATLRLLEPAASARTLTLNGAPETCVHAAGAQLQQVITNLVMNAIQATGPRGAITLTLRGAPHVQLIVDDDGPGIPHDTRAHVFEPFYTTKEPGDGTGLGLSIVHGIVQEHGGQIEVQDSPTGGARFVVTFPKTQGC
jgi:signal transduction histidine kinase